MGIVWSRHLFRTQWLRNMPHHGHRQLALFPQEDFPGCAAVLDLHVRSGSHRSVVARPAGIHVVLGHCDEKDFSESEITPRDVREVEAEAVALLCCESLGLPGAEFSRGYIQEWGNGQPISERSAQRIFHAADQILRAGRSTGVAP